MCTLKIVVGVREWQICIFSSKNVTKSSAVRKEGGL